MWLKEPLEDDPVWWGAALMPTPTLVLTLFPELRSDERAEMAAALELSGEARTAALLDLELGPRAVAALELGRRALLWPPPRTGRLKGPADVASLLLGATSSERSIWWVVAADDRGVPLRVYAAGPADAVRSRIARRAFGPGLSVGAASFVLARREPAGAARLDAEAQRLARRANRVARWLGLELCDVIVLGDDGHISLRRRGWPLGGAGYVGATDEEDRPIE
jgi:hypothetical protein